MSDSDDRQTHDLMNFVGMRSTLTTAALLQLTRELRRAGVLQEDAVDRIKDAVIREADFARRPNLTREESEAGLRPYLDKLLAEAPEQPQTSK